MAAKAQRATFGRAAAWLVVGLVAASLAACGKAAAPPEAAARAQQLIESGNVAYAQGDYRLAVKRYAAAAVVRKDDPAAYYGMGMALGKLGRDEEARAAYQHARDLSQGKEAGAGGMPPNHP